MSFYADSIIKTFGTRQVLTDIFIECTQGEIIGLLGRNGTGKSTLLKILSGSLRPNYKFIKVKGTQLKGQYATSKFIKYLPQHNFLPSHVKIKRLVKMSCNKETSSIILSHPLFSKVLNYKTKELSGGERRLFEIYLVVCSTARYLLLDEPFNALSPKYKEEVKELLRSMSKSKGIIVTDHDYRNILDVSTRLVLLYNGGIKKVSGIDELQKWGYLSM